MPSWRAYLVGNTNVQTGKRKPADNFENSQYCKMYSELFTNKEFLSYIQEKGYKNGYVLWPVRIAVSGKQTTPAGATEIMEVLGKEETIARIREGIRKLEA